MAYNIGQFRRTSNINDYYEDISNDFVIQYFQERLSELTSTVFFENAYYDFSNTGNKMNK